MAGRAPLIEIEDRSSGRVLGRALPATDNVATVMEALEYVLARVGDLVVTTLRGWSTLAETSRASLRPYRVRDLVAFEARSLTHEISRYLYHLCCYAPHWCTRWRRLDGDSLWDRQTLEGTAWNAIKDPGFRFYADPFPFEHQGELWLFVEDFDHRRQKGVISAIPFDVHGPSGPARPVLEEPWHLSYPFVFAHAGEVWMIPESSAHGAISLYRAVAFPHRWAYEATLVAGVQASDATLVEHNSFCWMFAATRNGAGSWSDTLSVFSAPSPLGPFAPHSGNPILIDGAAARPAGAFVKRQGRLWRAAQDCTAGYGTGIALIEVMRLDCEHYAQRTHAVLRPKANWPGKRLHTLNSAGGFEFVDGSSHSPRVRLPSTGLSRSEDGGSRRRSLRRA
jgi:hypothetical protein